MHGNEFLSGYSAKLIEYGLAVTYLVLFVGFWRYVQGGKAAERALELDPRLEGAKAVLKRRWGLFG